MTAPAQDFRVHVYRPSGVRIGIYPVRATRSSIAVERVKKRVYREGRLAHFYTFVAVSAC